MLITPCRALGAAILAAASLAVVVPALADSKPWPGPRPTYEVAPSGPHTEAEECVWQRQRVRVFDEPTGTYVWVWKRVRICS